MQIKSSRKRDKMKNIYIKNARETAFAIKKALKNDYDSAIAWADECLNGIICHRAHYEMERCIIPIEFNDKLWNKVPAGIENNDPEWIYAFSRHSILLNLAKAFAYTENTEYKSKFIEILDSFLLYADKNGPSWRSLEAGIRPENWIRSLEIFSSMDSPLPDSTLSKISKSLEEHKNLLMNTHRNFHRLSNWGMIQEHGLFLLGLYFKDKHAIDVAIERLEEEAKFQIFDDGTHWEQSPLYHTEILHSLLDTILLARNHGITVPNAIEDRAMRASIELYASTASDNHIFLQGDSDWIEAEDLLYTAKRLFPDLDIDASKREENYWDFGYEIEPLRKTRKKESIYLEDSHNTYLRGNDIEAHMYFGNMGSGHGHVSPLHVDIYAHNKAFIVDSGRYTYQDTKERYDLKSMEYHNTIIIDESTPEEPKDSWSYTSIPLMLPGNHKLSKAFDYSEATTLSYISKQTAIRRKLIRLGDSIIAVFDEIISSGNHNARILWHIAPDCDTAIDGRNIRVLNGNSKLNIWTNANNIQLKDSYISRYYNEIESNKVLESSSVTNGITTIATIFSSVDIEIRELPITLIDSNRILSRSEGIAFEIATKDDKWTIITRQKETVSQVDIMKAGDLEGYGMTLIKHSSWKYPERIM